MPDIENDQINYDAQALECYGNGDYERAAYYGKLALETNPKDTRLIQNLRWYNSAYRKRVYVTVLSSNDYINGVIVLDKSLKMVGAQCRLVCIITPDISEENKNILSYLDIQTIEKDQIIPPNADENHSLGVVNSLDGPQDGIQWWHKAMVKLSIFDLVQFDKVVYLDADMIVKQNIDELFDKPHMSAVKDCTSLDGYEFGDSESSFNSGLLVIEPNHEEFKNIINFLNNFDSQGKLIHDQLILQRYFSNWKNQPELHLDQWYAPWTTSFNENNADYYFYLQSKIKVLHIIDKKPWNQSIEYFTSRLQYFPYYAKLNLDYIDTLNYTIHQLNEQGLYSADLKIIT